MEENSVKKEEKAITSKKSAIEKEVEVIQLDEFDDNVPNKDIYVERSNLVVDDLHEPEYDETSVFLSWYDSDLNLVIDETSFTAASPLHDGGFAFLQAGARATFGHISGKVCFEVKLLQNCRLKIKTGHIHSHLLRVGWSSVKSCLQLGTENISYGYDTRGKISTNGEITDYGVKFKTGDVIGAFLEIDDEHVTFSFTVNGEDQGIAYKIPQSCIQKEPLFPHVLTKNISYECNFKGEKPWFSPKEGFTFVGDVPLDDRISGPKRPESKSDCEVILMCGLPKCGKTEWVNDLRLKNPGKYYVLDIGSHIDKEEMKDPVCKEVINRKAKVMGKLLAIAMDRKRNYILDQLNVVRSEQIWKLRFFDGFKRRIVVIVLPDEEYKKRIHSLEERVEDLSWLYQLKVKFMLPVMRSLRSVADKIDYVALPEREALKLVIRYHRETWLLGYKPHKHFVIPRYVMRDIRRKRLLKKQIVSKPESKDLPGSAVPFRARATVLGKNRKKPEWLSIPQKRKNQSLASPPVRKVREGLLSPPRQRMNEDWTSPPRKRKEHWPSPSRNKGNEHWQSPHRKRSGSNMKSLPRGRAHDNWPQERRRKVSASPPRFRPAGRKETREALLPTPRSRMEERQSRGLGARVEHTSSLRSRPSDNVRRASTRSPPRDRIDPHNLERNRFQERDGGGYRHPHDNRVDRGHKPPRTSMNEDWPIRLADEFPPQGRNTENIHEQGGRMGGGPHPRGDKTDSGGMDGGFPRKTRERAGRGAFPHHEHGVSGGLSPQEARIGSGFPPGNARLGRDYQSPRMDNELLPQERRFGGGVPSYEECFVDLMVAEDNRLEPGLLPVENRMNEGFLRQEGRIADDFPPQDIRVLMSNRPSEGRAVGMVRLHEPRAGREYSPPRGRMGNDHLPPGAIAAPSPIVGGLPPHERRHDIRLPEARGSARNLSPESIMVIDIHPREGRSIELIPPDRVSFSADYPLQRGRGNENLPEHDGGRARMLPPENRMIERIVDDLPPRRMSGDLPSNEGRMGASFHPSARLGGKMPLLGERPFPPHGIPLRDTNPPHDHDFPSHDGRMMGDLPPHDGRMMGDLPPHDGRMMGDFPSREERMMGDFPHREERMMGDFPPHEERMMGDFPPREERMMGDLPYPEERMMGDLPPHEERMMGNFPSHEERMMGDFPSREERMMGNFSPQEGRNIGGFPSSEGRSGGNIMLYERMSGDFPSRGGRIGGGEISPQHGHMVGDVNFPPGGRGDMSDVPHHRRDMPPPGGRIDADFPHQGRVSNNMIPPGRMESNDFSSDGRIGMPPHAGRIGGETLHHKEQFGAVGLFQGARLTVDHPPRARFAGDMPPHEMRMGDQQHLEGRSGPDERWSRLSSNPDQLNFGPPIKQEPLNEAEFLRHTVGDDGRNKNRGQWDRSKSDHPTDFQPSKQDFNNEFNFGPRIKQESLSESKFKNKEPGIHQNQWTSQDVKHRSFESGGNNHGPGPSYSFNEDREGGVRGPKAWRPDEPSNRGWSSEEGRGPERLPTNTSRDRPRSSPQKQQRLVGPNIRYRVSEDKEHDPRGWAQKPSQGGATDKRRDVVGRGAHKNLLEEDDEGLAPYEQPFNQSVWDSNEPDDILFPQGSDDPAGRTRGSGGSRLQDPGSRSLNKPGSVWQRVGGYVDDDDDDFSAPQRFGNQNLGDNFGSYQERSYEESNPRRGHDVRDDREAQNRFTSHRSGKGFPRDGSQGKWRSTDKKQMERW